MGDEKFYLEATAEVDGGTQDPALWAKAMAMCDGSELKAKYFYIRERALQMEESHDHSEQVIDNPEMSFVDGDVQIQEKEPDFQKGLSSEESHLAGTHDIRFDGENYIFLKYKYSMFSDALNYANKLSDTSGSDSKPHKQNGPIYSNTGKKGGVRGWLLWLALGLIVFGPIHSASMTYSNFYLPEQSGPSLRELDESYCQMLCMTS